MSWIARLMMRLYPGWWRQRYGVELQALVEDSSPTWWTVLDVGKEGLAPDGPNAATLTAFGLGAGVLAGLALAAWRRRAR